MLSTQVQQTCLYNTHLLHIPVMSLGHTTCRYKALFAYGKTKKIWKKEKEKKEEKKGVGRPRSARRLPRRDEDGPSSVRPAQEPFHGAVKPVLH